MVSFVSSLSKLVKLKNLAKITTRFLLICLAVVSLSLFCFDSSATAGIDDDKYEGNIYILYAGNGSLVPPRIDLKESLKRKTPAILVYYVDDSSDCKQYSFTVSRLQEYYGRAANIIPVTVDSLEIGKKYRKDEVGYYYKGTVPQTVILNEKGKVVFDKSGQQPYEAMDDVLRKVFDLLPREESEQLVRRSFNEYNAEITE